MHQLLYESLKEKKTFVVSFVFPDLSAVTQKTDVPLVLKSSSTSSPVTTETTGKLASALKLCSMT